MKLHFGLLLGIGMLLCGCVARAPYMPGHDYVLPFEQGGVPEDAVFDQGVTTPHQDAIGRVLRELEKKATETTFKAFQLKCQDVIVTNAKVTVSWPMCQKPIVLEGTPRPDGLYFVGIPKEGHQVTIEVASGSYRDATYKAQTISKPIVALGTIETIALKGRVFDGEYFYKARLNNVNDHAIVEQTVKALHRFDVWEDESSRTMIYDKSLQCTWYLPEVRARNFYEAQEEARRLGGEIPALEEVVSLYTLSRDWDDVPMNPWMAQTFYDARSSKVWVTNNARACAVNLFGRCTPPTTAWQREATVLVKFPGDRRDRSQDETL